MTMPAAIILSRGIVNVQAPTLNDYDDEKELRSFCLAFRPDDKIHLFPPSKQTAQLLRDTVEKHWTLDNDDPSPNCYTLNLRGTPFLMYGRRENAILVKYVCCLILERFKAHGWELVACTDLSSKTDLTAWYFARMPSDETGEPLRSPIDSSSSLVCLSLSSKGKLQLINASSTLQGVLRDLVKANYEPGIDQDTHYGRDYQIKLKGSPWDTEDRNECVAACKLILAAFRQFGANGYHLYGLVNLKDTADSFFFEYDPSQTRDNDRYMIVALDDHNILRLVNADSKVVEVVRATIDRFWQSGLESDRQITRTQKKASLHQQSDPGAISWEFVLKGTPFQAAAAKVGRSRQFVTFLLDALLIHGWTVVTGLDISRTLSKKSALLFQCCPPVRGLRHACLTPLGKQRYQLVNAPLSLRQLVRDEFDDVVITEKISDDESVYEMMFGREWWVIDPGEEQKSFIYVRNRMGRLLQTLMDSGWRVIASADVVRQQRDVEADADVGEGIHSWFVLFCGGINSENANNGMRVTANSVLHVGGRIGTPRPQSPSAANVQRRGQRPSVSGARSSSAAPACLSPNKATISVPRRSASPPPSYETASRITQQRRSRSGYEF